MDLSISDLRNELIEVKKEVFFDYNIIYFFGEDYIDLVLELESKYKDKEKQLKEYLSNKYKFLRVIKIEFIP